MDLFGLVLWKFSHSLGFFVTRVYSLRLLLTLVWTTMMKVPVLVSSFHSFSSSKFVNGRLLFCVGFSCRSVCIRFI